MRLLALQVIALLLLVSCGDQPLPSPTPPSPLPTALLADVSPSPTPTSTPRAVSPTVTPSPQPTPMSTPVPPFDPGPVILPTVARPPVTPVPLPTDPLEVRLDALGYIMSVVRDLSPDEAMETELITREELATHLREGLKDDRETVLSTQQLYITLGILQGDADYYELLLALYGEGVTGFFDTDEEKLYVVNDAPEFGPSDSVTYAHEFVHGLHQQHFDIRSIGKSLEDNADRNRAFRGLVEGDATIAETLYMFEVMGEIERAEAQQVAQNASMEVFLSAPHVVQRTVTFPYREGARFVASLYLILNDWGFVDRAYTELPESTEQILHPEKYHASEEPVRVLLPDIAESLGAGWNELARDTLGEFFLQVYLESGVNPQLAADAATGWGGDVYSLLTGPEGEHLLVALVSWDTEDDTQEFADTFLEFTLTRTDTDWEPVEDDGAAQVIWQPGQIIYIRPDGLETLLIFAPNETALKSARESLHGQG